MKKIFLSVLVAVVLAGCAASNKGQTNRQKEKELPVLLSVTNPSLDNGSVYLSDGFSSAFFIGRIEAGKTTKLRIRAPFTSGRFRLLVKFYGRVRNSVLLADTIRPGDTIRWDLFSNSIIWTAAGAYS